MKYLRAILNESLRIHPIVPENSRQAVCDSVLPLGGGEDGKSPALVKKGQLVAWSSYAMHRREDLYGKDAAEFKPERWLDDMDGDGGKGLRVGWEYLPFNGGPRICIGRKSSNCFPPTFNINLHGSVRCFLPRGIFEQPLTDESQNNLPFSNPPI